MTLLKDIVDIYAEYCRALPQILFAVWFPLLLWLFIVVVPWTWFIIRFALAIAGVILGFAVADYWKYGRK